MLKAGGQGMDVRVLHNPVIRELQLRMQLKGRSARCASLGLQTPAHFLPAPRPLLLRTGSSAATPALPQRLLPRRGPGMS